MAGEIVCGQGGTVAVGTAIGQIKGWTIKYTSDVQDATVLGSNRWREGKHCLRAWEGDFDTISYPGALVDTTSLGTFVTTSETGSKTYSGSVQVNEVSPTVTFDNLVGWKATFRGHGSLTIA